MIIERRIVCSFIAYRAVEIELIDLIIRCSRISQFKRLAENNFWQTNVGIVDTACRYCCNVGQEGCLRQRTIEHVDNEDVYHIPFIFWIINSAIDIPDKHIYKSSSEASRGIYEGHRRRRSCHRILIYGRTGSYTTANAKGLR